MLRNPVPLECRSVLRRGSVHGHRQVRAVQVESHLARLVGLSVAPGLVREECENVGSSQRLSFRVHRDGGRGGGDVEPRRRNAQDKIRVVDYPVLWKCPSGFPCLVANDGDAVSAAFHQERTVTRSRYVAHGYSPEDGGDDLVAGGLTGVHVLDRHPVRELARRIDLKPVGEHRQSGSSRGHRVVAVGQGVDQRLEDGSHTVLWHVFTCGRLPRGNPHVSGDELHAVRDLALKRSLDLLRIELLGSSVFASIVRRRDDRLRERFLRSGGTQQNAGHGGA